MDKPNFTPGPWRGGDGYSSSQEKDGTIYSRSVSITCDALRPEDGIWVADISVRLKPEQKAWSELDVALANARLIAAAPEMYEALKAILGFFESGEFVRDTSRDFEQGWHLKMIPVVKSLADAKAAIAKAEAH